MSCSCRVGNLVEGRVVAVSQEGLQLQLHQQALPALLPCRALSSRAGWPRVGDDLDGLLVARLAANGGADIVIPMSSSEPDEESLLGAGYHAQSLGKGRGGKGRGHKGGKIPVRPPAASDEGVTYIESCNAGRLRVVNDESRRKHDSDCAHMCTDFDATLGALQSGISAQTETGNEADAKASHESHRQVYPRAELLLYRPKHLRATMPSISCEASLPTLRRCPSEELEPLLLQAIASDELPPPWWKDRGLLTKRRALLAALRAGRMHAVFAMQPESQQFRETLACFEPDAAFLKEAMRELCADAECALKPGASTGAGKGSSESSSSRAAAAISAAAADAWGTAGTGSAAAEAVAWLLERGAPCDALLPETPGPEALATRLRGLQLIASLGPKIVVASCCCAAAVAGCLRDPEAKGRRAAAEALARLGPVAAEAAPRALPRLLRLLQSEPDALCREAAARALGCLGPPGVEAAVGCLKHEDVEVKGLAALALGAAGSHGRAHAHLLIAWLHPRSSFEVEDDVQPSHLRARAAQALGLMGAGPPAAAALAASLRSDADMHVREAAASALGLLCQAASTTGAAEAQEAWVVALDDVEELVREAAARALEICST